MDSGADYSVFPSAWASHLGIDLSTCEKQDCETAGGPAKQYYCNNQTVEAEIQSMNERVQLVAAFSDVIPVGLLGRGDFFAVFKVSFDERTQTFRLEKYVLGVG